MFLICHYLYFIILIHWLVHLFFSPVRFQDCSCFSRIGWKVCHIDNIDTVSPQSGKLPDFLSQVYELKPYYIGCMYMAFLQCVHVYDLQYENILWNLFSHLLHWYGLSPVCILICHLRLLNGVKKIIKWCESLVTLVALILIHLVFSFVSYRVITMRNWYIFSPIIL